MNRPLVLALVVAAVTAVIAGTVLRRPATHSTTTAVAVRTTATVAPTASPSASPAPTPAATRTAAPTTPGPAATHTPASAVTTEPPPTPTPTPLPARSHPLAVQTNVPVLQSPPAGSAPRVAAEEPPQIIAVAISNQTVAAGDVVNGHVETSSNVASVEASVAGYVAPLEKTGVGRFTLAYRVPQLPFFLRHRTYSITVTAHNVRGETAQTSVPITIQ